MADEYDSFTRRANENSRYADECRRKAAMKPDSATTYHRLGDEALAEMFFNDAMARGHSGNGSTPEQEARDLQKRNGEGIHVAGVVDTQVFHDRLDRMIVHFLESKPDE